MKINIHVQDDILKRCSDTSGRGIDGLYTVPIPFREPESQAVYDTILEERKNAKTKAGLDVGGKGRDGDYVEDWWEEELEREEQQKAEEAEAERQRRFDEGQAKANAYFASLERKEKERERRKEAQKKEEEHIALYGVNSLMYSGFDADHHSVRKY